MNKFDAYIIDYLYENKEVALDKIGTLKIAVSKAVQDEQAASVLFEYDKKAVTSEGLINFIAAKAAKNKYLIASDLESHLAQAREFINIGKSYELPGIGFIKSNKTGAYEFLPYSETNKPAKQSTQPVKRTKKSSRSAIQFITFLIVIAILSGLGWEAYQLFTKAKAGNAADTNSNEDDTIANTTVQYPNKNSKAADTNAIKPQKPVVYADSNMVNIQYIFETTASVLRAQTRTAQLKSFGKKAGYDSFTNNNNTKFYSLYILKPTKLADTLTVKDSIAKFLQKDIKLKILRDSL